MENIVYFLGAGFSAPLGLPVMSNFMRKAKDLYQNGDSKFEWFKSIFEYTEEKLPKILKFYQSDLNNIEEVLSILEMRKIIFNDFSDTEFKRFIIEVVTAYTPKLSYSDLPEDIHNIDNSLTFLQNSHNKIVIYLKFVLALSHYHFFGDFEEYDNYTHSKSIKTDIKYSIITTNYDNVIENANKGLHMILNVDEGSTKNAILPDIVKLHGCLDSGIITPNWNKGINELIRTEWIRAYNILKSCNHIRIIGYSLPETDSYLKFLFKLSYLENLNLKNIDIICMDKEFGNLQRRYENFFGNNTSVRYQNKNVVDYLCNIQLLRNDDKNIQRQYYDIENFHNNFMSRI